MAAKINDAPVIIQIEDEVFQDDFGEEKDEISAKEIFNLIRNISDPEHPQSLQELQVVDLKNIKIDGNTIKINFTPTIPHCSMATLIGLCIRVQLLRSISSKFKVDIHITPGTHQSEQQVNKQLNDKERVAAALENDHLLSVCNQCIKKAIV